MKKSMYVMTLVCVGLIATSSHLGAQTQESRDMMQSTQQQSYQSNMGQNMMGGMGMMGGRGKMGGMGMMGGRGMMGGQGMMGSQGMMGCMGMGPGLIGMGPSMHYHMMGGSGKSVMSNFDSLADFETFLDETKEQRKQLHDLRFDYMEKMRQPETTVGELRQMKQEILDLMQGIHGKAENYGKQ